MSVTTIERAQSKFERKAHRLWLARGPFLILALGLFAASIVLGLEHQGLAATYATAAGWACLIGAWELKAQYDRVWARWDRAWTRQLKRLHRQQRVGLYAVSTRRLAIDPRKPYIQ